MIKWLVRLGAAVGLLLIAFVAVMLILGGGRQVSRVEAQVELGRPASMIYPWLTEGPRLLKWIRGMESFKPDSELLAVGQRAQVVVVFDGHRTEVTSELLAVQPPTLLKLRLENSEFTDEIEYTLAEHEGKTLLTQRSSSHYKDLFVRLLSPLFVRDVERAMTANLATLQGLVEAEPSIVAPHPMPGQKGFHGCCAPELPSPSP